MGKMKETRNVDDIVTYRPTKTVTVLPPNSGIMGTFLEQTANMFKARAMGMNGLLRRIDEAGQRTESLLRTAAERMEAAETALHEQFNREGLVASNDIESEANIGSGKKGLGEIPLETYGLYFSEQSCTVSVIS